MSLSETHVFPTKMTLGVSQLTIKCCIIWWNQLIGDEGIWLIEFLEIYEKIFPIAANEEIRNPTYRETKVKMKQRKREKKGNQEKQRLEQ